MAIALRVIFHTGSLKMYIGILKLIEIKARILLYQAIEGKL